MAINTNAEVHAQLAQLAARLEERDSKFEVYMGHHDMRDLMFQSTVFFFDMGYELGALELLNPQGIARKIIMKNMILKMFEFQSLWQDHLQKKIISLADPTIVATLEQEMREVNRTFRPLRKKVDQWKDIRNGIGGHYDRSAAAQRELLKSIEQTELLNTYAAFMEYVDQSLDVLEKTISG